MPTLEILPIATTSADSADITVTAGTKKSFFLKAGSGVTELPKTANVLVMRKAGTDYVTVFRMTPAVGQSAFIFEATNSDTLLRFRRGVQDAAIGVDQE